MSVPRVFISYAHESPEHRAAIKALADWLLEHGVEAITDQPHENRPPETGWNTWMLHNIQDADLVLVVCTASLKARYEKREDPTRGLGATHEGAIITQTLYEAAQRNDRFFPILPDGGNREHIPTQLRDFYNGHSFPSGNERILKLITECVTIPKPQRPFQPLPPGQLRGPTDNRLQPRESHVYGREREIAQVLEFLHGNADTTAVCAHVTGAAGIGKTEICKAALKRWLEQSPQRVFFIDVPDTAGAAELIYRIGRALGAPNVAALEELQPLLREGLYYLDNLENVAENPAGQHVLQQLREQPGLRILASSRIALPGQLGKPIRIDRLPPESAVQLFRDSWTGAPPLEDSEPLRRFVHHALGDHALSITLTSRLGESYDFPILVCQWDSKGTALAADTVQADTRGGSLTVSLSLTADRLRRHEGTLLLWTLAALFPAGMDEEPLASFERSASLSANVRQLLSRHNIWTRRDDRFHLLPPVARYALDEAAAERGGFSWNEMREHGFGYFMPIASQADSITSTPQSREARGRLLDRFGAVARLLEFEAKLAAPRRDLLAAMDYHLTNVYQFRTAQARELLRTLRPELPDRARATFSMGILESRLGAPDEARRLFQDALALYEHEDDILGQANTLVELGVLERHLGDVEAARGLYQRALIFFENEADQLGRANVLISLGELEWRHNRDREARVFYSQALALYEEVGNSVGKASALHALGWVEAYCGQMDQAQRLYSEALDLYRSERDDHGQARTLRALGDAAYQTSQLATAQHFYEEALVLHRRAQTGTGEADTLSRLGELELLQGNTDAARRLMEEALEFFRRQRDSMGQANTLLALADLERVLERIEEARDLCRQALGLYENAQVKLGMANAVQLLGDLEVCLEHYDEARRLYTQAHSLYGGEHDNVGRANVRRALGHINHVTGDTDAAMEDYQAALACYTQVGQHQGAANASAGLARCYHAKHDESRCDESLLTAVRAAHKCGSEVIKNHVHAALVDITGSTEAAEAWLNQHTTDFT